MGFVAAVFQSQHTAERLRLPGLTAIEKNYVDGKFQRFLFAVGIQFDPAAHGFVQFQCQHATLSSIWDSALIVPASFSAARVAMAMMVTCGLAPREPGTALPSITYRPLLPNTRWSAS